VWLTRHLPPYIPSLPFIGDLPAIATKGLHVLCAERAKKYKGAAPSGAFRVFVGSQVWVVTADPEASRRSLNKLLNRPAFKQIARDESGLGGGRDLASLRGEKWRRMRLQWTPTFATPSLAGFAPLMDECAKRLADRLEKVAGEPILEEDGRGVDTSGGRGGGSSPAAPSEVDVWRLIGALTLDVVGTCAFGARFRALDDDENNDANNNNNNNNNNEAANANDNHAAAAATNGKRLVVAAREIFASGSLTSGSGWQALLIVFPLGNPLWQRLAVLFPDSKLKKLLRARKTVADAAVALVRQQRAREGDEAEAAQAAAANGNSKIAEKADDARDDSSDKNDANPDAPPRDQAKTSSTATPPSTISSGILPGSFLAQILKPPAARTLEPLPPLEDLDAVAQSALFVLAGYETTANTVACAVYSLSTSPSAQRRLCAEIDAFFGRHGRDAALTPEAVAANFPFADACVREALRLYTPVTVLAREVSAAPGSGDQHAPRADLLQPASSRASASGSASLYLRPGITIASANYVYQRDPDIWPRAEDFLPERWVPEDRGGAASVLGPSTPNAWTPFGGGPRVCVGQKFAMLEAIVALVRLSERFHFSPGPSQRQPLPMKQGLTLSPDGGVWVTVRMRGEFPFGARSGGGAAAA
jgi:cytochrome P450